MRLLYKSELWLEMLFQIWSLDNTVYRYSYQSCIDVCIQNAVRKYCHCYPLAFPSYTEPNNWTDTPFCLSLQQDGATFFNRSTCMDMVINDSLQGCYKDCRPPCNEFRYNVHPFDTSWPSKAQHIDFYKDIIRGKPFEEQFSIYKDISALASSDNLTDVKHAKKLLRETDLIEDNFAKVSVYLSTTNIVVYRDKPSTTLTDLLASLGGTLNLYSGISLIIIVEIIDLFYGILFIRPNASQQVKQIDNKTANITIKA